jgi:hypothetical protein
MNSKPKFWNADKIVSLSAILISLATMTIYLYQTHLIIKQQHASVMPYLMVGQSSLNDNHMVVNLQNNGLGPAFVEKFNVYYQGKKYENCDLATFFNHYNLKKDTIQFGYGNLVVGQLIPANKEIEILLVSNNKKEAYKLRKYFWGMDKPIELEIIYSSIYGEKWRMRGNFARPEKLDD